MSSASPAVMRTGATAVVVAERGGEWEGWIAPLRAVAAEVRVIAQRPSETASDFAARVRAEAQRLEGTIEEAVLVGAPACDPEILGARALVVRALTSRMPIGGRLQLAGAGKARLAMEALAQIVSAQLQASGVWVATEPAPAAVARSSSELALAA